MTSTAAEVLPQPEFSRCKGPQDKDKKKVATQVLCKSCAES